MIEITNKRLHDYIEQKDNATKVVRKLTGDMEAIDIKIKRFEEKEKRITGKVIIPKELTDKGDMLLKELKSLDMELTKIANEAEKIKLDAVPKDMKDDHMKLLKEREGIERERNKGALKVQKIKDRIIPLVQKEVKPLLEKYDDIETAQAKGIDKVIISTFNHLEDFKKKFK